MITRISTIIGIAGGIVAGVVLASDPDKLPITLVLAINVFLLAVAFDRACYPVVPMGATLLAWSVVYVARGWLDEWMVIALALSASLTQLSYLAHVIYLARTFQLRPRLIRIKNLHVHQRRSAEPRTEENAGGFSRSRAAVGEIDDVQAQFARAGVDLQAILKFVENFEK